MLIIRTARLALSGLIFSILSGPASAAVNIPDPDAVDAVIDRFVEGGHYPFIYARLEDRDGNVVYEHGAVNRDLLRVAHQGELDIFGADVPGYGPDHELYLGGEGMLATADGYADFLRMLLNHGTLNGQRLLETATVENIYAPHTQFDNPEGGQGRDGAIRAELYRQFWTEEAN